MKTEYVNWLIYPTLKDVEGYIFRNCKKMQIVSMTLSNTNKKGIRETTWICLLIDDALFMQHY